MFKLTKEVIAALNEIKAQNIRVLDVTSLTVITDHMIIATGTSNTHVKAISQKIIQKTKQLGYTVSIEDACESQWILLDINDVIVHIMLQETRDYYQLEKLWATPEFMHSHG